MKQIILRQEAIIQDKRLYFTGVPCKHGHLSDRLVSDSACRECKRLQKRDYYRRDKEFHVPQERVVRPRMKRVHEEKDVLLLPVVTRVAIDIATMRPGTPKVQVLLGCDATAAQYFPKRSLVDEATEYMRVYPLDRATHQRIIKRVATLYPIPRVAMTQEERLALIERQRLYSAKHRGRPTYPSPRAMAKAEGKQHYMSEQPCTRGHRGLRLTSTGYCLECQKLRVAARYESRRVEPTTADELMYIT